MRRAIENGKFATEADWCRGILSSTDERITIPWRTFAQDHLKRLSLVEVHQKRREMAVAKRYVPTDPKAWARKLQAEEEAGAVLEDCQRRAWRVALDFKEVDNFPEME